MVRSVARVVVLVVWCVVASTSSALLRGGNRRLSGQEVLDTSAAPWANPFFPAQPRPGDTMPHWFTGKTAAFAAAVSKEKIEKAKAAKVTNAKLLKSSLAAEVAAQVTAHHLDHMCHL